MDSPSLLWLQWTSDPEGDIAALSEWMRQLNPPKLTQVVSLLYSLFSDAYAINFVHTFLFTITRVLR